MTDLAKVCALKGTIKELAAEIYAEVFGELKYKADDPSRQDSADVMGRVMKHVLTGRIEDALTRRTQWIVPSPERYS